MKTLSRRVFATGMAASALMPSAVSSQCAPISLGIPNIPQQTNVWCWAAVAQQIIVWRTGNSPPQCALVAIANGAHPQFCCTGNPQCVVTGHLQQIQFLIARFGGAISQISPPAGPGPVYNALSNGKAIIMAVQQSQFAGHVVVINGMSCFGTDAILHINDPIGAPYFSQPTPFVNVIPYWRSAIVVS